MIYRIIAVTAILVMAYRAMTKLLGANATKTTPPVQVHKMVRCSSCGTYLPRDGEAGSGIVVCNNCADSKKRG